MVWWAAQEWGEDPERKAALSPMTLLKQQSSQGYRTFAQYLDLAGERWRQQHEGQAPPWEPQKAQPVLALAEGAA